MRSVVPVSALIFRSAGLQVGVVGPDNKAKLVNISLGRDFGNEVEVVTGLNGDEQVIVNPPDSLVDGEQVQIVHPQTQQQQQSAAPQPGGGSAPQQKADSK